MDINCEVKNNYVIIHRPSRGMGKGNTWISMEKRNRNFFFGGLRVSKDGSGRGQLGRGWMKGESMGRDGWKWGSFGEQYGNLMQWKLSEISEGDLSEDC